jgi:hypothetical protein
MRLLSLSLLLALTACSAAPTSSQTSSEAPAPAPVDEALASQVVGTYATQVVLNSIQPVPAPLQIFAGKEIKASGRLYLLTQIANVNGVLKIQEQYCALRSDKVAGAQLSLPDATIQKNAPVVSNLEISEVDGAVTISRGVQTLVVGAKLVNPATDALPTDTRVDADRIVDFEGDKKPGATSHLSFGLLKGDIYFIQRSTNTYEATLGADGELSGVIHDKTEQVLLGGTGIAAGLAANKTPTISVQDPESPSTVRFIKIEDGSDCKAASNERLFN